MSNYRGSSRNRRLFRLETEQHRRVLDVAKFVSATLGGDFFRSLVEHLSKALAVDCVYIGELICGPRRRLRTITIYRDNVLVNNLEQELPGTASSQVLEDGAVSLSADAARIFPLDPVLEAVAAQGFVGLRLCDSTGQVMGLIALVSSRRLHDLPVINAALQAFAVRAAAEMERKRAFDKLRESEERYRAFISSSLDAMWRIEFDNPIPIDLPEELQLERIYRDAYVAECNGALARLVGASNADDLVGTSFADLFSRTDDRVREELYDFLRSGYSAATVQTTTVNAEGDRSYRIRTQYGIVENSNLVRIWGTTRDITELKRAVLAAEASERRFRQVLEKIQSPALMLDPSGNITFCNDKFVHLAGSSKQELTCRNWLDGIDSTHERNAWLALLTARDDPAARQHLDSVIRSHDGIARLIVWDTILLRDENGGPVGLAAIGTDKGPAKPDRDR